jgi:hypothetical protein
MGYSHPDKVSGINGVFAGAAGHEVQIADPDGHLFHGGTELTPSAATINGANAVLQKSPAWFTTTALDGSTGKKACVTNGVSIIAGGTGIADMSLAAPSAGDLAIIRIGSITSGSVKVTCGTGISIDGTTNKTITFDAADEAVVLAYKSATQWQTVLNIGGAVFAAS